LSFSSIVSAFRLKEDTAMIMGQPEREGGFSSVSNLKGRAQESDSDQSAATLNVV
jgi:hypothetical protein